MLQLFHLLRPLVACLRVERDAWHFNLTEPSPRLAKTSAPSFGCRSEQLLPSAATGQCQQIMRNNTNNDSGLVSLLKESPAFVFAVAVALLRHAEAVLSLSADASRIATQVQLVLLAASDFGALLHAHCGSNDASQESETLGVSATSRDQGRRPPVVISSAAFRQVLHALLSLLGGIVVKHSKQICASLALTTAAAEIFSRCGRHAPLPSGSKMAVQAIASAAIAALKQPASSFPSGELAAFSHGLSHKQRLGGAEELRKLALALEALQFVELK